MAWVSLGSLILTKDWQLINNASVGGTLFRISQSWDFYPEGKALISQAYGVGPDQFYGTRGFYPSNKQNILEMTVPDDFLQAGINTRYLALRYRSRYANKFQWTISIEEFQ